MKPPLSILKKDFIYINSANTDISKTFARIRKQLAEQDQRKAVYPIRLIGNAK